ncbi:hypothetical protein Tco_1345648 [Tanacetum coccineum]
MRGTLIGSGQVATTCEQPSGQVYVVRNPSLDKSLDVCERTLIGLVWSLRLARNVGKVYVRAEIHCRGNITSYGKPWSSRYDVRGTLIGSGLVFTTCEEPSGKVYIMRETLVKSLRRARNVDRVWSGRYDVRGTVGESLRRATNLGQVVTTCEEPSSGFVWSLRRTRNRRGKFTCARNLGQVVYDVPGTLIGSGLVYDGPRNLDRLRSRFLGALVFNDVPMNVD